MEIPQFRSREATLLSHYREVQCIMLNVPQFVTSRLRNHHQQIRNVTDLPHNRHPRSTTHDMLNCLTMYSWVLPFCGIPVSLRLSFSVNKRCMTDLEDRNSNQYRLINFRGFTRAVVVWTLFELCFMRLPINSYCTPLLRLCEFCQLTFDRFVLKLRSHDWLNTVLFWVNLLSECY